MICLSPVELSKDEAGGADSQCYGSEQRSGWRDQGVDRSQSRVGGKGRGDRERQESQNRCPSHGFACRNRGRAHHGAGGKGGDWAGSSDQL